MYLPLAHLDIPLEGLKNVFYLRGDVGHVMLNHSHDGYSVSQSWPRFKYRPF